MVDYAAKKMPIYAGHYKEPHQSKPKKLESKEENDKEQHENHFQSHEEAYVH